MEKEKREEELRQDTAEMRSSVAKYCKEVEKAKKQIRAVSTNSILSVIVTIGGAVIWFCQYNLFGAFLVFVGLMFTIILLGRLITALDDRDDLEAKKLGHERFLQRVSGEWEKIPDTGAEYTSEEQMAQTDKKIFGEGSLYQYICHAHTTGGKKKLAEVLKCPDMTEKEFCRRQQAVQGMSERIMVNVVLDGYGCLYEKKCKQSGLDESEWKENLSKLVEEANAENPFWVYMASGAYLCGFCVIGLGVAVGHWHVFLLLGYAIMGIIITLLTKKKVQKHLVDLYKPFLVIGEIENMLWLFSYSGYEAPYLKALQYYLVGKKVPNAIGVSEGVRTLLPQMVKMKILYELYNWTRKPVIHLLVSGIGLFDVYLLGAAITWIQKNGRQMVKAIDILEEVEMLNSLASIARLHQCCIPSIDEDKYPEFIMRGMFCPLEDVESETVYDIQLEQESVRISSERRAEPEELLPSVGMNLVLAYAGSVVCAEEMRLSGKKVINTIYNMELCRFAENYHMEEC